MTRIWPPRTGRSRGFALLTLLVHLLLVGAGPAADAFIEASHEVHEGIHFHSSDDAPCSPGHRHDHCQICRTLQSLDTPPDRDGERLLVHTPSGLRAFPSGDAPPRAGHFCAPLGARAPPLV